MAEAKTAKTIQSGIKNSNSTDSILQYALFLSGTNVTHDVLANYDPLKTGYARIFMVRQPAFLVDESIGLQTKFQKFKHIIEYGNTSIQGLNDIQMNFNQIQGGYVGKQFEIPSYASDDTNSITIKVYEFSGSPIREIIHAWINGTSDLLTGFAHYNGSKLDKIQANQTAEFIYVNTDNTGKNIEYACMFANCFPKGINLDVFNYTSGEHNLVETDIEFTCTKYESPQINKVAKALLSKYKLLTNSMYFNSGIDVNTIKAQTAMKYDSKTGKFVENVPVPATADTAAATDQGQEPTQDQPQKQP